MGCGDAYIFSGIALEKPPRLRLNKLKSHDIK